MRPILERKFGVEVGFCASQNELLQRSAFLKQSLRSSSDSVAFGVIPLSTGIHGKDRWCQACSALPEGLYL